MMTSPSSTRVTRSDDRGVGAIWLAVGMTLFMAFAGMAVDLGNWYLTRTEVQTATDAAALAGSALLPADTKAAGDEARRVAANHGFPSDRVEIEIIDGSIMRVRITGEADNFFLPAIGFGQTQVVSAEALAEYEGNVAMGSPENAIGNDPESTGVQPDFTLGVEGPGYTKVNGDRFQPNDCGSNSVSYCDSTSGGIQNEEFDSHGYFFAVNVAAANGQDLVFDVYDPAYVTGNNGNNNDRNCDNFLPSSTQRSNLEDLTDDGADYVGYDGGIIPEHWYNDTDVTVSKADAEERYDDGRTVWCVGDSNGDSNPVDTTIIVREPDDTPWNPLDNPAITQVNCRPSTFGYHRLDTSDDTDSTASLYQLLDPTNTTWRGQGQWKVEAEDPPVWTLAEVYRRWVTVCRVPGAFVDVGKYLIQVTTSHSSVNPEAYDPYEDGSGLNAFSIRAGFDDGSGTLNTNGGNVTVHAEGHLPIFANSDNANPEFHLARVLEVSRDRTLTVEIFDIGDAGSLSMTVLPPADSNMSNFSGCEFELEGHSNTPNTNSSTCSVTTTGDYNGRVLLIQVPLPDSYECDETVSTGCWVKLRMNGSDIHDFTTWSAYISGDPVRLIE